MPLELLDVILNHPPCSHASQAFADENHVGGLPVEEIQGSANAVSVPGILDVDDDFVAEGREHRFDEMADG